MDCCNIVRWPADELGYLHHLRSLHVWRFEKLERMSSGELLSLPLLEKLDINGCDSLLEIVEFPTWLEQVHIGNCRKVVLPSTLGNLAKLRVLSLSSCGGIQVLPDGMDALTSLEELWLSSCQRIEEFPRGLCQRIPHLKQLTIHDCGDLQRRCREGGEYFDLFSSIPRKFIQESPPAPAAVASGD